MTCYHRRHCPYFRLKRGKIIFFSDNLTPNFWQCPVNWVICSSICKSASPWDSRLYLSQQFYLLRQEHSCMDLSHCSFLETEEMCNWILLLWQRPVVYRCLLLEKPTILVLCYGVIFIKNWQEHLVPFFILTEDMLKASNEL